MLTLALAGLIGSGKDSAAEIFRKNGFFVIDYAQILRGKLRTEGIELSRENLQAYRKKHGKAFLAEETSEIIRKSQSKKILLTPMRTLDDFLIPKKEFGARLVWIESRRETRFQRLKSRKRENDPLAWDQFSVQDRREKELFDFEKLKKMADFRVENNGTRKALEREVTKMLKLLSTC